MAFNATFNIISVISWWKLKYPEKTTDLLQVINKPFLYRIRPTTKQTGNYPKLKTGMQSDDSLVRDDK